MSTDSYDDILKRALAELTVAERRRLAEELAQQSSRTENGSSPRSILELDGLGKGLWRDMDPDEYIRQERSAWDG